MGESDCQAYGDTAKSTHETKGNAPAARIRSSLTDRIALARPASPSPPAQRRSANAIRVLTLRHMIVLSPQWVTSWYVPRTHARLPYDESGGVVSVVLLLVLVSAHDHERKHGWVSEAPYFAGTRQTDSVLVSSLVLLAGD